MAEKRKGSCCSLPIDQPCAFHGNIKQVCKECPTPLPRPDECDMCQCSDPLCQLLPCSNCTGQSIMKGCVMSMDFLSARDHLFAIPMVQCPDSSMLSWLHGCHSIAWSWFQFSNPVYCHMLHIFFVFSTDVTGHLSGGFVDSHRSSRLEIFLPNLWSRFMPVKSLSVATCNESVVVKSNLTFDLRDEPTG